MDPKAKRDCRLRRQILQVLHNARAAGPLRGRTLMDIMENLPEPPESDEALMALAADLVGAGLATETDVRTHRDQRRGLHYLDYAITAKGTALLAESIPVNPLVADPRIG